MAPAEKSPSGRAQYQATRTLLARHRHDRLGPALGTLASPPPGRALQPGHRRTRSPPDPPAFRQPRHRTPRRGRLSRLLQHLPLRTRCPHLRPGNLLVLPALLRPPVLATARGRTHLAPRLRLWPHRRCRSALQILCSRHSVLCRPRLVDPAPARLPLRRMAARRGPENHPARYRRPRRLQPLVLARPESPAHLARLRPQGKRGQVRPEPRQLLPQPRRGQLQHLAHPLRLSVQCRTPRPRPSRPLCRRVPRTPHLGRNRQTALDLGADADDRLRLSPTAR